MSKQKARPASTRPGAKGDSKDQLAEAGFAIARALELLGNGDADTGPVPIGAIEGLAKTIGDGLDRLALSIDGLAYAIQSSKEK
jgi:hypothetical protein